MGLLIVSKWLLLIKIKKILTFMIYNQGGAPLISDLGHSDGMDPTLHCIGLRKFTP